MEWEAEWGEHLEFLEAQEQEGYDVPALDRRPRLPPRLQKYLDAFYTLSHGRVFLFGACGLPLSDLEAYCRIFGVYDQELFVRHILAMDRVYLSEVNKKPPSK